MTWTSSAANEQVDHDPRTSAGANATVIRRARPHRQDEQEVAHERLGEQAHQGERGKDRVGARVAEVLQRADQSRRRAHLAHEQPPDQQQADRDPGDPARPPPPRPDLARPGSIR